MNERVWLLQILERLEYCTPANDLDYLEFCGDSNEIICVEFDENGQITSVYA